MRLGVERLISDSKLLSELQGRRTALLAHPASVTRDLTHSIDALNAAGVRLSAAFGPQHGLKGDKQYNMIESDDFVDAQYGIPVFSLYGKVRRPTPAMMDTFDMILFDLQDLGTRIYTFITTMLYVMEACANAKKEIWVLDRPNPVGRPIEGLKLVPGMESFVGAGPLPMRHGLTVGELALWFKKQFKLDVNLRVIEMEGYVIDAAPGFGWDTQRNWINPSPNAPNLSMARVYPGSVLLEGTTLSEGRGTTRPLEVIGAPDLDFNQILREMRRLAPACLDGCRPRILYFEPTFYKHQGKLCQGLQFHVEDLEFYQHLKFKPYRIYAIALKAIRRLYPDYPLWRDFAYEYETSRLAIDVINGSPILREWADDAGAQVADLESLLTRDEAAWKAESSAYFLYR